MSLELGLMAGYLVLMSVLGMPIGVALITSGMVYLLAAGMDVSLAAAQTMDGLFRNFIILAVPLFIFAARIMNAGSITDRLLQLSLGMVGRLRGGLAQVNILTSLIFSGMSGSAVADASGVGYVLVKMMTRGGRYPAGYANAITAASATIGPIFPPSIPMIVYSLVSGASVGALFLGGMIPAFIMVMFLGLAVYVTASRSGFPTEPGMALREFLSTARRAILPMFAPILLLGGIYSGAFTPTEAAAVASLYALILVAVVYREQGLKDLFAVLLDTAVTSTIVMIIVAGAFIFNFVVAIERIPAAIASTFIGLQMSPTLFLVMLTVIFLVLGMFLTTNTIMLVVVPLFLPAVRSYGIDLVHFGVVVVVNAMIGLITPPYGVLLFILSGLTNTPVGSIIRSLWPFLLVLIIALFCMVLFPWTVLWLPRVVGFA